MEWGGGGGEDLWGSDWFYQYKSLTVAGSGGSPVLYLSKLICNHICFKRVIHFPPIACETLFIPTTGNLSLILMSFNWNVAFEKECIWKDGTLNFVMM